MYNDPFLRVGHIFCENSFNAIEQDYLFSLHDVQLQNPEGETISLPGRETHTG